MPAYREYDSQVSILNRLPTTGLSCSNGCFENGNGSLATGEPVWTLLSEQKSNQKDEHDMHVNCDIRNEDFLHVGQAVTVDLLGRRMTADVVRNIPCSHNVELCLHDGAATRIIVDQHDVHVLQNNEGNSSASQKINGITGLDSWKRAAPLVIDIPNYDNVNFRSQDSQGAEEKMAAAVLTSLSLSPVLKNMQVEHDKIFQQAMSTASASDKAISPTPLSDQENWNRKSKLRRRKNSLKTVFQCTWPRCRMTLTNSSAIFKHVRAVHLGPKKDDAEGYSDGEEEFYFIEVERNLDDVNEAPSENSLSPPTRTNSRRFRSFSDPSMPTQPPVSSTSVQRHVDDNFIWSLRTTGGRGKTKRHLHQTAAHMSSRKSRGDGKKCRKVFGMDHKHLWCTQCRWKKACVRFVD